MLGQVISLLAGLIFSLGLTISGMINPNIVKGFLDIFGNWDFSLVFVMGGSVLFNYISFRFLVKRTPLCSTNHFLPNKKDLDSKLILGSALFGIGWGLIGICPGPALVNLATLNQEAIIFTIAMFVGMFLFKFTQKN